MPSRIELAENLWLLYICLQNSDYKAIDFNAVGEIAKLKPPAARMRFTRLRRAIEDGTLIDTHGKHFQGSSDKIVEAQKKRKKPMSEDVDCNEDDEEPIPSRVRIKASQSPFEICGMEKCEFSIMSEGGDSHSAGKSVGAEEGLSSIGKGPSAKI